MTGDEDPDLGALVDRTLLRHAERNEQILAWLRAGTVTSVATIQTASWLQLFRSEADVPFTMPLMSGVAAVLTWLFVVHLSRGGYRRWMQIAAPIVDGAFLSAGLLHSMHALGTEGFRETGSMCAVALECALLVQSGALRLNPISIAVTTGAALLIFGAFTTQMLSAPIAGIGGAALLTIGALAYVLTRIVRSAVRSEVARVALRRFLPGHVVDRAHEDPARLLTEPRSVDATILFTDIRGFTAWAERRSPSEVLTRLNELQGMLAEHVREHGGTVDKFMGDGMLAVFGAPEPASDHAERALAAVRAIRDSMRSSDDFKIGIGVHSGEIVMGCLGKGFRLEFTVIGDTVNTASRLEALTKTHGVDILVSGAFKERLANAPEITSLGEVPIRGRAAPLPIYTMADR